MHPAVRDLAAGLVVSCQAYPGEPLDAPGVMPLVAEAAERGGAAGVRMQGEANIAAACERVAVPVIGLIKTGNAEVFITPTLEHARAVCAAGAQIVALDGTRRPRPDGRSLKETVSALKQEHDAVVMADCGCLADGLAAQDAGVDLIGTTLAGYTLDRPRTDGPDLALVEQLSGRLDLPVLAEGRVQTPDQARMALEAGAFAVVVGTAITHPTSLTSRFREALGEG